MPAQPAPLYTAVYACLLEADPDRKVSAAQALYAAWQAGALCRETDAACPVQAVPIPGRPAKPELVYPKYLKHRKLSTPEGRFALLHAVAHIEFNAINLALDAAYRFRAMPDAYYGDWLQVAAEEASHFSLVRARLHDLGGDYGDLPAHNGLWEQACKTADDVLVRMALVPRVMEARGLDVTPGMMARLQAVGDAASVAVLEVILRDEIGHVRIGSAWYHHCCQQRGLAPEATFLRLLREVAKVPVRSPLYEEARLQAGFTAAELAGLRQLEADWDFV